MDAGKISIIVPCYNIEGYIEKTVLSILSQTYENLEVILVDDGSTDETPKIIDRLAEEHILVSAFHKTNGGVSSARLYGIDHSSGDWITFVDGDDLLMPEMYSLLIHNAITNESDISHCGYEMVFPDYIEKYYGTGKVGYLNNYEGQRDLLLGKYIEPSLCNKVYRRELVLMSRNDCEKYQNIRYMEDLLWNYFFFKRADKSIYEDQCFYQYVLRKGSAATSGVNKHQMLDPLKVFKIILLDNKDSELKCIVREREAAKLIQLATMKVDHIPEWAVRYVHKAQSVLRRKRQYYMNGTHTFRLKMMILLVSLSPEVYAFIHKVYSILRGTNHKYRIN